MLAISRPKIEGSGVLLLLETQNIMGDTENIYGRKPIFIRLVYSSTLRVGCLDHYFIV